MTALYRIQSEQTEYFVVSTGAEKPGDKVVTLPPVHINPTTIVAINPPVEGANVKATVKGKHLYIAVHKAEAGVHLIWSEKEYEWEFATNGPAGTHSIYVPGEDLYWFDKLHDGHSKHIVLKPGRDAVENEIFFKVEKVVL